MDAEKTDILNRWDKSRAKANKTYRDKHPEVCRKNAIIYYEKHREEILRKKKQNYQQKKKQKENNDTEENNNVSIDKRNLERYNKLMNMRKKANEKVKQKKEEIEKNKTPEEISKEIEYRRRRIFISKYCPQQYGNDKKKLEFLMNNWTGEISEEEADKLID